MSLILRILLIVISLISMFIMMRKIRNSKVQIEYSIFWILFAAVLIFMAAFPTLMGKLADLIGIQSPVNMIYLMIIFILIVRMFYFNIQISQLEHKVNELVQLLALNEHKGNKIVEETETKEKKADK